MPPRLYESRTSADVRGFNYVLGFRLCQHLHFLNTRNASIVPAAGPSPPPRHRRPSLATSSWLVFFFYFSSIFFFIPQFGKKVTYFNYLSELHEHLKFDQLIVPPEVQR